MIAYAVSIKYMAAGYSFIFIILAAYLASLVMRWKRLRRDLQSLESIDQAGPPANQIW
jgi:Flp pilus assembly protein TadB